MNILQLQKMLYQTTKRQPLVISDLWFQNRIEPVKFRVRKEVNKDDTRVVFYELLRH